MQDLLVKRLRPSAVLPVRGSADAAGFDLSASEPATVPPGGKAIVKTGLSIAIPENTYARIAPRSGLAAKRMISCGAGVVDFDYRGEVGVVLFNHGAEALEVAVGDRVAQLILERVCMASCREVDTLEGTARGAGGFGSTGVSGAGAAGGAAEAEAATAAAEGHAAAGEVEVCPEVLRAQRLRPSASLPVRGSEHAAGFDLAAAEGATVRAGGSAVVKTGLAVAIPRGTYARIAPRSGLAAKRMIHVGAGVVDFDYRGEVGVVLFNHGPEDFEVAVGDRVAQMVLEAISMAPCQEVDSLDSTQRGAGGFGSTGVSEAVDEQREQRQTPEKRARTLQASATPVKDAVAPEGEAAEVAELRKELAALRAELASLVGARAART